jgi:nitroreductase
MSTATKVLDTFTAIEERRSVKHYDPHHVMPQQDIDRLLELAMLSPTSFNIQNWRFVVVTDKGIQGEIKNASWGQSQVQDASVLLVLCADLKAWDKEPSRYWKNAPEQVQQMIVPMIGQLYANNEQLERDEAMRSIGIAAQTLMIAAKAIGYDSCPMVGFDPQKVAEIIHLPADHIIGMLLPVGKATEPAKARSGQLSKTDVVTLNRF